MKAIASSTVAAREIARDGGRALLRSYLGGAGQIVAGPQAVIVEMPDPGARIEPHFHDVDQFQIFIGGSGTIGAQPVRPVTFHYADAFTPYGPIVAGGDGIVWFTLRLAAASAVYSMPESRHLMQGKAGRIRAGNFEPGLAMARDTVASPVALLGPTAWRRPRCAWHRTPAQPACAPTRGASTILSAAAKSRWTGCRFPICH